MVGLVLVSHSKALAFALEQMLVKFYDNALPVAIAAGAGKDGQDLGTDASAIVEAIEKVCGEDGVLVLLDLGSAVLSAEFALDLLDEEMKARVVLCSAPLVEGAIAAGAQIKIGAPLSAVRTEAERALSQKTTHLGSEVALAPPPSAAPQEPDARVTLRVETEHGLHARPAMRIVQTVARFESEVQIRNLRTGGPFVSARSLVAINCLEARQGDDVEIIASGADAEGVITALTDLQAENFGDAPAQEGENLPEQTRSVGADSEKVLHGESLSAGVAIGPICFAAREALDLPETGESVDVKLEVARLRNALSAVRQQLDEGMLLLKEKAGGPGTGILEAHRMLIDDHSLGPRAVGLIQADGVSAARAWQRACGETVAGYRALADVTLRERAQDIEDLSLQVFFELGFKSRLKISLPAEPFILVVPSLLPSDVVHLDFKKIRGVVAESLGKTSHAAILLRSAGVPAVDGISIAKLRSVRVRLGVDGDAGEVWIDPAPDIALRFEVERISPEASDHALLQTKDGRRIEIAVNVANPRDAEAGAKAGAEAIGLLRTEFLFLDRSEAPDEDEQTNNLWGILEKFPMALPVTIRTLDIGGDKPAPYLPMPTEANPFLGVRGLRLTLRRKELFLTHLRAILRSAEGRLCRVMFPMVTDVAEIRRAREILQHAHEQLVSEGVPHAWPVEVGMMVEVPAAAINVRAFVAEVDFFSIGTNDLTQYTLAAERGHPQLREFTSALHPAVLRLVSLVATAARRSGKWAGICGEAAADPEAARLFVGLGITELSMGASSIERVRSALQDSTHSECRSLACERLRAK